jgi:hypothetical protein
MDCYKYLIKARRVFFQSILHPFASTAQPYIAQKLLPPKKPALPKLSDRPYLVGTASAAPGGPILIRLYAKKDPT